jgi:predicted ATPase
VQDAAYASLLKSTRQQYHQQVAQLLEARFPATVATEPELVAHHYTEAGCAAQAVGYWQQAGQRALQRSANIEAIAHLRQGIALLTTLPDTPARIQAELTLQTTLGPALMATRGYGAPEVAAAYNRARELCQQAGDTSEIFPVLFGLWLLYLGRAEHETARELAEQCLSLPSVSTTRRSSWRPTPPWGEAGSFSARCPRRTPISSKAYASTTRNSTMPWRCATGIETLE